ncbi:MAG: sulfate reduction electron transfer complex DsrMKJOP subunit DsrM, partial [Gemmatimonadetes bacterium]|nr:sulfate reduction electron transfer complex DsrMKJOP subunit DsrM [Gemmatimonadota bacterium]
MIILVALAAVGGLFVVGMLGGVGSLGWIFGVIIPSLALLLFLGGMVMKVMGWSKSAVPFRIPTTCGQQKGLDWIPQSKLENPFTLLQTAGRMALEVLFFRSLLRNTKAELVDGRRLVYRTDIALWLGGMLMHWSFLIILIRHLRLMTHPVPSYVSFLEATDGFLEIGLPAIFITTATFLLGVTYLLYRRLTNPQVRYISLIGDYFPLFLLLGIGLSGAWMRHLDKVDIASIKELMVGLFHFAPVVPEGINPVFYGHLFLVSVLLAYFPFSTLT